MKRFAKQKLRTWLHKLLHTHDSAERTAFAFALGVFIAFLPPVPWFHTLIALLLAFVFRLNRVATLLGTYINTPFTFLPLIAIEISLGLLLVGGKEPPDIVWGQFDTWQGWKDAAVELKPFLAPMLIGACLLGLLAAAVAYFVSLKLILAYRHRMALAALERQAELELNTPGVRRPAAGAGGSPARAGPRGRAGRPLPAPTGRRIPPNFPHSIYLPSAAARDGRAGRNSN